MRWGERLSLAYGRFRTIADILDSEQFEQIARTSTPQLVLLAAILGFAGGWYLSNRASVPAVQLVNGTYRNPCCAAVELKDGVLTAGAARVGFTLENMKFGLTAYPVTPVEVDGGRIIVRPDGATSSILFNENVSAFTLCGGAARCAPEYKFSRF